MGISTKPPSGTRDFLPDDIARREFVVSTIRTAYERHGFVPLETPTMERIEVLTGKYGDEGEQLIFKVLKRGQKLPELTAETDPSDLVDMALRYDLTVPLARVVAAYGDKLPRFFKRFQIQPVWRADRPQKGRYREFYQCDVDFVGTDSLIAELTVVQAVTDALAALGFDRFDVRVNDRRILTGMLDVAEVPEDLRGSVLTGIDKLDKIGADGVRRELAERGLSGSSIDRLAIAIDAIALAADAEPFAASRERLAEVRREFGDATEAGTAGLDALEQLFGWLEVTPPAAGRVVFDPSLARGLSYYTGPIFEIAVEGLSGSMGGGGRYDELVGMFRGRQVPSVGFSLGLERILVVMEERGMFPALSSGPDVFVARLDEEALPDVLRFARRCREAGLCTEVYPEPARLKKQLRVAESLGVKHVVLIGVREAESGTVALKNLVTGAQDAMPIDAAIEQLVGSD